MTDLKEIRNDILRDMYAEASPPLSFDDALQNPDEYGDEWYKNHYLDEERHNEIFQEHLDKHNLTDSERTSLNVTIMDLGPTNVPPEDQND